MLQKILSELKVVIDHTENRWTTSKLFWCYEQLEKYADESFPLDAEVKVNFAEIVKEILQEGANIANYGNPFESEDTVRIGQEILFDETVEKYSNILSKISA